VVESLSLPTALIRAQSIACGALLALALSGGCNAFDDPPSDDDFEPDDSPPSVPVGGRFAPPFGSSGAPVGMSPGVPPSMQPPGMCVPCGEFCSDCGRGCECQPGHTMFDPVVWNPPFTGAGSDGWRESTRPLCPGMDNVIATHVWGDRWSVYALVAGTALSTGSQLPWLDDDAGVARTGATSGELMLLFRTRVFRNEGKGWTLRADLNGASDPSALTSIADSLFVYGGAGEDRQACTLGEVTGDEFGCKLVDVTVHSLTVVSPTLAYALEGTNKLRVYDGAQWKLHPEAIPRIAAAIWADEQELVAVGVDGTVMRLRDDVWTVESVGKVSPLTAVWGVSGNDLWVGTFDGALLHFDGSSWQERAQLGGVSCSNTLPIKRIWGVGSHVWVNTSSQLARWNGSELTTFGNWSCSSVGPPDRIHNVWGTAEDDVFISVAGGERIPPCGAAFVVHYDGELFHRF